MSVGVNNIRRRVERAVANYLAAESDPGANVNVYCHLDAIDARVFPPCVIVHCRRGRPMNALLDATSGATNRYVDVVVTVRTWAADEETDGIVTATAAEAHDALVGRVMDLLHVDGLPAALTLNAPAGVTISQVDLPTDEDSIQDGGVETAITFTALAHGTAE